MFKVGEKIIYPLHGAGEIDQIVRREVGGVEQEYYDITLQEGLIRVSLPVSNAGKMRIRRIIGKKEAGSVLEHFKEYRADCSIPWNKRYKENLEVLKTGDSYKTAEVVKLLMLRDRSVGLSTGDRQTMIVARNLLAGELSLSLCCTKKELLEEFQQIVESEFGAPQPV